MNKKFFIKSLILLVFFSLTLPLFAKDEKKLPDEVQAKIKTIKETNKRYK